MEKQNIEKELSPILENESIQIGAFKANRSIDTLDLIKENIKFWKSYDGHKLPNKQVKRLYYNGTKTQNIIKMYRDTPEKVAGNICQGLAVKLGKAFIYDNRDIDVNEILYISRQCEIALQNISELGLTEAKNNEMNNIIAKYNGNEQ